MTQHMHKACGDVTTRLAHVGRLDRNTTGLLMMTTDTELATVLCLPGLCTKEYIATVRALQDSPPSHQLQAMMDGVELSDGLAVALVAEVWFGCDSVYLLHLHPLRAWGPALLRPWKCEILL